MSLSTPTKVSVPFATSGLKTTIPATSNNTTGRAGYDQGFPPINMTALAAGGIPPFGQDVNGILFDVTTAIRYLEAGNSFPYDSTFATAIGGYNAGAVVSRTDGTGFWLNTVASNTTDPEAGGSGWVPGYTSGVASVTMTGSNVTLTAAQYGKPIIVITGTLTANLNLIFPNIAGSWVVINNTTGAFTITAKTSAGTGTVVSGVYQVVGDGTNIYAFTSPAGIVVGTAVSLTSGTQSDSATIPSNAKRFTINLYELQGSTIATNWIVQLRDSASTVKTTGYLGSASTFGVSTVNSTTGFMLASSVSTGSKLNGRLTFELTDPATNTWSYTGSLGYSDSVNFAGGAGTVVLPTTIGGFRLTSTGNNNVFGGSTKVNYTYET